jgi:hypothetical protein
MILMAIGGHWRRIEGMGLGGKLLLSLRLTKTMIRKKYMVFDGEKY